MIAPVFPTETQTLLAQALFVFMWVLFAAVSLAFRTDSDTELELIHSRRKLIIVSVLRGGNFGSVMLNRLPGIKATERISDLPKAPGLFYSTHP